MFGLRAARMLQPEVSERSPIVLLLGFLLLFTLPFWGIPLLLYSGVRLFVYETILLSLSGRQAFEVPPESDNSSLS